MLTNNKSAPKKLDSNRCNAELQLRTPCRANISQASDVWMAV